MMMTKDHIGGLVFLCLSVLYGYYAGNIQMLPGDEFEPFTARTVPHTLAILGGILSIALLLTAKRSAGSRLNLKGYDFALVAKLLVLIVGFGLALEWTGFMLATLLFLIVGFWLLGERRIKMLLMVSVPFAVGIWFVLAKLLDIYLAPGQLYMQLFGG
ncbi:tripartite tricarboxylate transporter TctB family protein [Amphritea sp. 1_MG-2023]|uniref:tripartite tricarboxylate transporter TctB family protein n=1 Tax=Amphritea sp. 1_MG-2023 TaxID=3062670 RepID=UPI0026E41A23|nr:tripartite tricarboxylate transporter TctB family protein [Amphritea sp. 1_MG-2023]MDO6561863.1 tripartite tricarboxylate transporter TctB family protein [Amphritea sp. 1_MG-2023]